MKQLFDLRHFAFLVMSFSILEKGWNVLACPLLGLIWLLFTFLTRNYFFGKYSPYRLIRPLVSLLLNPAIPLRRASSIFHSWHEILIKRDIKGIKCAVIVWAATRANTVRKRACANFLCFCQAS